MERSFQAHAGGKHAGLFLIKLRSQLRCPDCLRPNPVLITSAQGRDFRIPTVRTGRIRFASEIASMERAEA
jgi:hypothetical protein